jgi:16S rRNA (uracil1498-N3)-methyltransferase
VVNDPLTLDPMTRLFFAGPLAADTTIQLDNDASHHALRVLRLERGDLIELFNGDGLRYPATLLDTDARAASVQIGSPVEACTDSPLRLKLAQALPSGDKMDWVVEKAIELGVHSIQPLLSSRSILRLDASRTEKRLAHWRRIAIAACMQCGRDRVPEISAPVDLSRWLIDRRRVAQQQADLSSADFMLSPRGSTLLREIVNPSSLTPQSAICLLVGPEAGLSEQEESLAIECGWIPVRLGPRILRTETAGLAALAALQARFGDL